VVLAAKLKKILVRDARSWARNFPVRSNRRAPVERVRARALDNVMEFPDSMNPAVGEHPTAQHIRHAHTAILAVQVAKN
jgi:hypothetical protein